ncbi:MAG: spore gernimation protein, partial [Firmicutes bacterium]|nr:spore gernimation protein [Bacillota bacterium]
MVSKAKRALTVLLTALALLVTLTGCWDDKSLDTRTLVLAMGFYPGPKPGTIQVDFEYPTPSGLASSNPTSGSGSSSSTPPFDVLSGIGNNLSQAFSAAQAKTSRDLYLGHTILLVFSTKLKPDGLRRLTGALNRIGTLDKTPFVVASPAPFDKVVGVKMPQEEFPSLYYEQLFSCTTCSQLTLGVRLWQMTDRLLTPGVDLVLPVLTPTPEGPAVASVAIYHKFQYVTTLTPKQTTAYGIAAGMSKKTGLYLPRYWQADFNAVSDTSTVSAWSRIGTCG